MSAPFTNIHVHVRKDTPIRTQAMPDGTIAVVLGEWLDGDATIYLTPEKLEELHGILDEYVPARGTRPPPPRVSR